MFSSLGFLGASFLTPELWPIVHWVQHLLELKIKRYFGNLLDPPLVRAPTLVLAEGIIVNEETAEVG